MPLHHQVLSLQSLSLKAIGTLVVSLAPSILSIIECYKEPQKGVAALQNSIEWLKELLASHVPHFLYDDMAVEVLTAVKGLIERTKKTYYPNLPISSFLVEMNVVVSMTEVVLTQHFKKIDFSVWPKIMRYVLYKNLYKLTGLEVLNLGSCTVGWRTGEYDKCIAEGINVMKNLRSLCLCFDCTDSVVQIIGETCTNLQSLDITSSRSVTDRSINSLLCCTKLRDLHLHRTSVTVTGFAQILIGLTKLQDIGRCDEFGSIIKYLHSDFPQAGPFGLKRVQTRDLTTENLRLLVDMFPEIEQISLFHDEQISDLTVLTSLENLRHLKLLSCAFYGDYLRHLLEIRGSNILSLHLEHVEEIDLNALTCISQCCPNLNSLVLYNCDFMDQRPQWHTMNDEKKPFQKLERLFWVVDCAITHLEYILINAYNIRYIHLGSSTGITHNAVANILKQNPMRGLEELRILFSSDMGIHTARLLLASCPKLRLMSELESWQGISVEALKAFKQYIQMNNFDLDIRPTLSYY